MSLNTFVRFRAEGARGDEERVENLFVTSSMKFEGRKQLTIKHKINDASSEKGDIWVEVQLLFIRQIDSRVWAWRRNTTQTPKEKHRKEHAQTRDLGQYSSGSISIKAVNIYWADYLMKCQQFHSNRKRLFYDWGKWL